MQLTRPTDCEDRAYLAETAGHDLMIPDLNLPKLSGLLAGGALRSGLSSASEEIPSRSRGCAKFERLGGGFAFRSLGNWSSGGLPLRFFRTRSNRT